MRKAFRTKAELKAANLKRVRRHRLRQAERVLKASQNVFSAALIDFYYHNGIPRDTWVSLYDFLSSDIAKSREAVAYFNEPHSNLEVMKVWQGKDEIIVIRPISFLVF